MDGEALAAGGWRGVRECGQCARRGACAVNDIQAEGAVALAAALQGNTTLQTLVLNGMWTARKRVLCRNWGPTGKCAGGEARAASDGPGAACASAGSEHGVVHGADNIIDADGAVALAAALQGNTTLQTLGLRCMWTARWRIFCGTGRPLPGRGRSGEARASGGCGRRGVRECGQ